MELYILPSAVAVVGHLLSYLTSKVVGATSSEGFLLIRALVFCAIIVVITATLYFCFCSFLFIGRF